MAWGDCDVCDKNVYYASDPFVEMRLPRPSDRREMTCILAGHRECLHGGIAVALPSISEAGGTATPQQWQAWITSDEARRMGFLFLT